MRVHPHQSSSRRRSVHWTMLELSLITVSLILLVTSIGTEVYRWISPTSVPAAASEIVEHATPTIGIGLPSTEEASGDETPTTPLSPTVHIIEEMTPTVPAIPKPTAPEVLEPTALDIPEPTIGDPPLEIGKEASVEQVQPGAVYSYTVHITTTSEITREVEARTSIDGPIDLLGAASEHGECELENPVICIVDTQLDNTAVITVEAQVKTDATPGEQITSQTLAQDDTYSTASSDQLSIDIVPAVPPRATPGTAIDLPVVAKATDPPVQEASPVPEEHRQTAMPEPTAEPTTESTALPEPTAEPTALTEPTVIPEVSVPAAENIPAELPDVAALQSSPELESPTLEQESPTVETSPEVDPIVIPPSETNVFPYPAPDQADETAETAEPYPAPSGTLPTTVILPTIDASPETGSPAIPTSRLPPTSVLPTIPPFNTRPDDSGSRTPLPSTSTTAPTIGLAGMLFGLALTIHSVRRVREADEVLTRQGAMTPQLAPLMRAISELQQKASEDMDRMKSQSQRLAEILKKKQRRK
ncbi:MAG: hypothetical protein GFH27_549279n480 [Chloroflexi bacterium AL-W]|nr:hypothetical protein [Chloroflexi bacterium AL-N1]NOK65445.1 hypothetical protein [Chloroflexi bacterium AL-N10]NOK72289.1 hypothetical protein [Chloroflexi bacterium AL-N5]NOK79625.1 hypothetical protein [Chloroflexi bacterium AL-W]NOK87540.1 hypothetical protein [Chloroflexi bacterium AL-N15]